jgi:murein L,D-transpeptidase YcbB/YkuD
MGTPGLGGIYRHIFPVVLITVLTSVACSKVDREQFAPAVQGVVATKPKWVDRGEFGNRLWAIEQQFYEAREYTPAWIDGDRPTPQLDQLLEVLRSAAQHGLEPADYGVDDLHAARAAADEKWFGARFEPERIPELDLRLTYAFLEHAADLLGWRHSPRSIDKSWLATPKKVDLADQLGAAIDGNDVRDTLASLAPVHPQYKGLQAALSRARQEGSKEHVERISLNLERWRWVPRHLGERHVLVNVPSYQMQVVEGEKPVLAMRVIVGAPDTPTPLFSDNMTYVVFSPYWNIPDSILREETLPRLTEDPDYLVRNNMEVVGTSGERVDVASVDWADEEATKGLRFRQAPGPENALGLVKFIFPNHFSVYLHDTPGDALFKKQQRALSHGCIRVEQPVALAEYVLADNERWKSPRIVQAMNAKEEQTVTLKEPLPVHIGYWTAWVEEDGKVTFTDDPYGLDRKHAAARARVRPR